MDPEIIEAQVDEVVTSDGKSTKQKNRQKEQENPLPNMSLRTRLTLKMVQLVSNPKTALFLRKRWWPLWFILGILVFSLALVVGIIFFIWRLIALIFRPYTELFTRRKNSV